MSGTEKDYDFRTFEGIREVPYYHYTREERHFAAILFHLLAERKNVEWLIGYVLDGPRHGWEIDDRYHAVYFEYAYLRDLWNRIEGKIEQKNKKKISFIKSVLDPYGKKDGFWWSDDKSMSVRDFNSNFIQGNISDKHIQQPGRWQMKKMVGSLKEIDLVRAIKLKWSFNVKPDIVLQLNKEKFICIELKYKSPEGSYSFEYAGIDEADTKNSFSQREIQKFMFKDVLKFDTEFLYVTEKDESSSLKFGKNITWKDLFCRLTNPKPKHMLKAIERFKDASE